MTGVTKAVVCAILMVHIKDPLLLIKKISLYIMVATGFYLVLYHMSSAV